MNLISTIALKTVRKEEDDGILDGFFMIQAIELMMTNLLRLMQIILVMTTMRSLRRVMLKTIYLGILSIATPKSRFW